MHIATHHYLTTDMYAKALTLQWPGVINLPKMGEPKSTLVLLEDKNQIN